MKKLIDLGFMKEGEDFFFEGEKQKFRVIVETTMRPVMYQVDMVARLDTRPLSKNKYTYYLIGETSRIKKLEASISRYDVAIEKINTNGFNLSIKK